MTSPRPAAWTVLAVSVPILAACSKRALKDDGMVELLVPESLRGQMWLVDEGGEIRVLNYYQDDQDGRGSGRG